MGNKHSKAWYFAGALLVGGAFFTFLDDSQTTGVSGISNLGNTCFLNAILQALSSCDSFSLFLTSLRPLQSPSDAESAITKELLDFLQSLSTGQAQSPDNLIDALSKKFPFFGEQHDSHEIFYVISEALSHMKKRTDNSFILSPQQENPMLGLTRTEITCERCKNKTVNLETIFDLSLIVSRSLFESLENFEKTQILDDFLCLKCSTDASVSFVRNNRSTLFSIGKEIMGCRKVMNENELIRRVKTKALIRTKISRFPLLLCIHCKWLIRHDGLLHKRDRKMEFPERFEVEKGVYQLKAVVEHAGGGYGGHYFTYKTFQGGWYLCSDLEVKVVALSQVLTAQAYMLFYELICSKR
jgi:ubiquitin C-terminal hydrolase